MPTAQHHDLLVGSSTGDDAAVWRVSANRALVATVDFFSPVVDDARTWGRIAAANSASDVYAMGGTPLFALSVVAWPRELISLDVLGEALAGAAEAAHAGGWIVAGGHTVDGPEPLLGQSVTGEVDPDVMLTNAAGRSGDVLVLTKPLGTGVITTALKRSSSADAASSGRLGRAVDAAVASMSRLNAAASEVAIRAKLRSATDVTGFGLAGHLHKLAAASGVSAKLNLPGLPLLPDVGELVAEGFVPGGTGRNLAFVRPYVAGIDLATPQAALLGDPQTSGGLLLCVPPESLDEVLAGLEASGDPGAVIGTLGDGPPGTIDVLA